MSRTLPDANWRQGIVTDVRATATRRTIPDGPVCLFAPGVWVVAEGLKKTTKPDTSLNSRLTSALPGKPIYLLSHGKPSRFPIEEVVRSALTIPEAKAEGACSCKTTLNSYENK